MLAIDRSYDEPNSCNNMFKRHRKSILLFLVFLSLVIIPLCVASPCISKYERLDKSCKLFKPLVCQELCTNTTVSSPEYDCDDWCGYSCDRAKADINSSYCHIYGETSWTVIAMLGIIVVTSVILVLICVLVCVEQIDGGLFRHRMMNLLRNES